MGDDGDFGRWLSTASGDYDTILRAVVWDGLDPLPGWHLPIVDNGFMHNATFHRSFASITGAPPDWSLLLSERLVAHIYFNEKKPGTHATTTLYVFVDDPAAVLKAGIDISQLIADTARQRLALSSAKNA